MVADVWEKDVWDFQAKSGSSGSCRLCLYFLEKSHFKTCLGERLEVPASLLPDIRGLLSKRLISRSGVVNFTLPGLRIHTLQTQAFSSFASRTSAPPRSSPGLARSSPASPAPRPLLARPRPASPGPHPTPPTIVSSNLAVKTGKREIY